MITIVVSTGTSMRSTQQSHPFLNYLDKVNSVERESSLCGGHVSLVAQSVDTINSSSLTRIESEEQTIGNKTSI